MSLRATVIKDVDGETIEVEIFEGCVSVSIPHLAGDAWVMLTPTQSATLRAALEAAEKEMS